MILLLHEPRKALNNAFLKIKVNREPLECFKVNLLSISIYENKSERFSKNLFQDFLKTTFYDLNHSLNNLGRNISMASIAETLIGKKIEAKTPVYLFIRKF